MNGHAEQPAGRGVTAIWKSRLFMANASRPPQPFQSRFHNRGSILLPQAATDVPRHPKPAARLFCVKSHSQKIWQFLLDKGVPVGRIDPTADSGMIRTLAYFSSGRSSRSVEAMSSSSSSDIVSTISFEAPCKPDLLVSPRFAESAAPAACCCFFDCAFILFFCPIKNYAFLPGKANFTLAGAVHGAAPQPPSFGASFRK